MPSLNVLESGFACHDLAVELRTSKRVFGKRCSRRGKATAVQHANVLGCRKGRVLKGRPVFLGRRDYHAARQELLDECIRLDGANTKPTKFGRGKMPQVESHNDIRRTRHGGGQNVPIIRIRQPKPPFPSTVATHTASEDMLVHKVTRSPKRRAVHIRTPAEDRSHPLSVNAAGPLCAHHSLPSTVDCQPNEEIAQEVRIQNAGIVDGDEWIHAPLPSPRNWTIHVVQTHGLSLPSHLICRTLRSLEHLFSVDHQSDAGDAAVLSHQTARQIALRDELDDEWPRNIQKPRGLSGRHFLDWRSLSFALALHRSLQPRRQIDAEAVNRDFNPAPRVGRFHGFLDTRDADLSRAKWFPRATNHRLTPFRIGKCQG
jgi:hypothetical protein